MAAHRFTSTAKIPNDVPPGYTGHVPAAIDKTGQSFGATVRQGRDPNATRNSPPKSPTARFGQSMYRGDFEKPSSSVSPVSPVKLSDLNVLITLLRERLRDRGAEGIRALGLVFRNMDDNGNRKLDEGEFRKGLADIGLRTSPAERALLMEHFDHDGDGNVSFDELLFALRGQLSARRRRLVEAAFRIMDRNGNGVIAVDDVTQIYNARKHPKVISGEMTEEQALSEFLYTFEACLGNRDGTVTLDEWINYYSSVSMSIDRDRDDYFALMMKNAWGIDEEAEASSPPRRSVAV